MALKVSSNGFLSIAENILIKLEEKSPPKK
jgi:hypothetical protein